MKKYLAGAAVLLLVGGGCVASDDAAMLINEQSEDSNEEIVDSEAGGRVADPVAFPSGTFEMYRGEGYALPIDQDFQPEQNGNALRLQNFVSQDDPGYAYADDAFFIEIVSQTEKQAEAAFREDHQSVLEATLGGEEVLLGEARETAGESWPGHSYFSTEHDVSIRVSYLHPEGREIAEAILSHIVWE